MLTRLIDTWLAMRRANGFALRDYERHLHRFAAFATACGEDHIRTDTAVAWAGQAGTPVKDDATSSGSCNSPAISTPRTGFAAREN